MTACGGRKVTNEALKVLKSRGGNGQRLDTRAFDLYRERYGNLTELARAMGISVSQIYRVKQGKRHINEKFITGTVRAFPRYKLDDLSCIVPDGRRYDRGQ